jgi:hypothetical protein
MGLRERDVSGPRSQTDAPAFLSTSPWYEAYLAVIFESDRTGLGECMKRAEQLMISRERELFSREANLIEPACD